MAVDATDLQYAPLGELPPLQPDACFGREELVEQVVEFAKSLKPIALIGAGGIGKTSISLAVLHDDGIREKFGDNRRFIRCDQLPASRLDFLARLSKVIGAGVENPEDLTSLQPFLLSRQILIVLDNAESILDPQGANAQGIYRLVDQLCRFKTLCVCITSRITTVPPRCKRPKIQTLSMEAARDIFYDVYGDDEQSTIIDNLLKRLDFHALSITLLATVASHNAWDFERLAKEWSAHRAQVLRTDYNESLAATLELSLASPTFQNLGPEARDLLGVVAFFPQGVDEQNLDWLFSTIPDRRNIFDKFCVLSLTYRSGGFVTALAPIRDYLRPQHPQSSPPLCVTRDHYFTRLSVNVYPDTPGFVEAKWIVSEDVNVEHLLDVFTSINKESDYVWDTVYRFMEHLYWHKSRQITLGQKIESLPDDHPSKPHCLSELSRLFYQVGNREEAKRLLTATLKLRRERGDEILVAETLRYLSETNRTLQLHGEGIEQAKEALEIVERCGSDRDKADCLISLARLFLGDKQLDEAEDAASRAIELLPEKGQEYLACRSHRSLGDIYNSKGAKDEAIHHFDIALAIASSFKWSNQLYQVHYELGLLFLSDCEFDGATAHLEQAKPHVVNNPHSYGLTMLVQVLVWLHQRRFEDARSEALGALEIFEKLGVGRDVERCRRMLQIIDEAETQIRSFGELLSVILCSASVNIPLEENAQ